MGSPGLFDESYFSGYDVRESPDITDNNGIDPSQLEPTEPKILRIKLRNWLTFIIYMNILAMILALGALASPRWVEQGTPEYFWRGSILSCSSCQGKWKNQTYKDISDISCGSLKGYCTTFENLYHAGITFILVETAFFLLCTTWVIVTCLYLMKKNVENKLIKTVVVGTPCVQSLALIIWTAVSGATMDAECYDHATTVSDSYSLCATHGPYLIVVSIVITAITSACSCLIRPAMKHITEGKILPYEIR